MNRTLYIQDIDSSISYEYKGLAGSTFQSVERMKPVLGTTRVIAKHLCYMYTAYLSRRNLFSRNEYRINWVLVDRTQQESLENIVYGR